MAMTIPADPDCRTGRMQVIGLGHIKPNRRQAGRASQHRWRGLPAASDGQIERPGHETRPVSRPASPPGIIGGAIVQAARRSAHLTRLGLARSLNVNTATVRTWERCRPLVLFALPPDPPALGDLEPLRRSRRPRAR
jgi:hypothetical protein